MDIREDRLREIILRILRELEEEKKQKETQQKIYMLCMSQWDERYQIFLENMDSYPYACVYPVIPLSWKEKGYESVLRNYKSCHGIMYRSCEKPTDYESAITLFPVVSRELVVKTALCISDTFETSWLESCIEAGSRVIFLRSGLKKFSGKETESYQQQILSYYRKILTYGIEMKETFDEGNKKIEVHASEVSKVSIKFPEKSEKKRVITVSNIEQYASGGVLYLQADDIVTDLAKDKAKFLNIVLKQIE